MILSDLKWPFHCGSWASCLKLESHVVTLSRWPLSCCGGAVAAGESISVRRVGLRFTWDRLTCGAGGRYAGWKGSGYNPACASSAMTSQNHNIIMLWLHVKWNYFKIISAFVDVVRLKWFYFKTRKLAWNYVRSLLQIMNILQHVQCRWNNFELISVFYFSSNHVK